MAETADIVVIGGGVMGMSIGYHLARRRAGHVIILEKAFLGAGGSGKSGAIIRQYYAQRLTAAMAQFGLRFFERFSDLVGGPPVFTHTGLVAIAREQDRAMVEGTLTMQRDLGIRTSFISGDELRAIDPQCRLAHDETAFFEQEAGYCEGLQVIASLAAAARQGGVEIREGTGVRAIDLLGGRVVGVSTPSGSIATQTVILATGPWSALLLRPLGVDLPVRACRTQVALFRRPADFGPPRPVYGDFRLQIYFKPTHGEMLHVGNLDPREEHAPVDPDDYNEVADLAFTCEMRGKISGRYPAMCRSVGRGGFGALYDVSSDWHPIIDRIPGIDGAYLAIGFSGHGFKLAPAVGQVISELVLDGASSSFDLRPLRARRFMEGELFGGEGSKNVMGATIGG